MGKIPLEEEERVFIRRHLAYSYYDSPDGKDLLKKLIYTGKIAFWTGMAVGLANCYTRRPLAVTTYEKIFRCTKAVVPLVGVASAFTTVTYFSTKLRGKDDEYNYVLGGIASGSVFGAAVGSGHVGFWASVLFSCIGYTKKNYELSNTKMFDGKRKPKVLSSYYKRHWDFSLMPNDLRGNWTKELPEK